ncbi:DUF4041 domain-containing protein [Pseudomonas brassicae]|uniref:DUF4041 domain-containing protein n=1 Tax=Pseudomonas brassicae TaxID=2708063 RepID=UPI001FB4FE7E|nr:DUF4041 domain-containing protein [Pseudomonas brassicae]
MDELLMELLALIAFITAFVLLVKNTKAKGLISQLKMELAARQSDLKVTEDEVASLLLQLQQKVKELERFKSIVDAEAEAARILGETQTERGRLLQQAQSKVEQAESRLKQAIADAEKIVANAQERAKEVAGEAFEAMGKAKHYADAAQAMKNVIEGYGDAYIVPTYNLLDDLAEEFGFAEAGQELKAAREYTRLMVKTGRAAACEYVETNRRETALRFVVDAFNGKVDSILSRSKSDNHGKLEQEIRDAAALVNLNGAPFRNARITDEYLISRLEELRWAVTAKLLKEQEREEQRQLREQIREEEKARRE